MKFYLYWLNGQYEEIEGETIEQAFSNAGYGGGAIRALDFFSKTPNDGKYYFKVGTWHNREIEHMFATSSETTK